MNSQSQKYDDEAAQAAAAFAWHCLHHRRAGGLDCDDKFILYHNRAGDPNDTLALEMGKGLEEMGWTRMSVGQHGHTFAWVVFNYERRPVDWQKIDELLERVGKM